MENNYEKFPGRISRHRYMQSTRKTPRRIWRPAVQPWEKEFCLRIGSFTWEKFLEAKKYINLSAKVMQWNDTAAEEAFHHAKNRFRAEFHNLPFVDTFTPNPDLYIDEIDWNSEIDSELLLELELALQVEEEDNNVPSDQLGAFDIPIEEIEPTGWDVVYVESKVLTGLIVGDHCSYGEGGEASRP